MSNSGDKRSVSTDALETLGTVHEREEKRYAIHIAVEPVEAGEKLRPGEHVTIENGIATGTTTGSGIGIVDPYLADYVRTGQRFWCLLYPRTIKSLRHVWSHPGLPDESGRAEATPNADTAIASARASVHLVAEDLGVSDRALMDGARRWLTSNGDDYDNDGYMFFGNDLSYSWDMAAFWSAYALLTGEDVPEGKRQAFFRCAC